MPVILLVSLIFLFYILSTIEPEKIKYIITNMGIKVADKKTAWSFLGRFWFSRRFDSELLIIEAFAFPGRMELVFETKDKERIRKILSNHLVEEEIPPSWLDKTALWFSKKLPGNH